MKAATLTFFILISTALLAQHATAPNGYYPATYAGATFTGKVVATDPVSDTVTMEYNSEKFSVKLNGGCKVPSSTGQLMHANNIPTGTVLTAYYMPPAIELRDGKQEKVHPAIAIEFIEWQGEKVTEKNRKSYPCGDLKGQLYFRAYR
jgi:hypothetical protein